MPALPQVPWRSLNRCCSHYPSVLIMFRLMGEYTGFVPCGYPLVCVFMHKTQQLPINWFWAADLRIRYPTLMWTPRFSKVGLFLTVEHCRSAAMADNMQSQGRLNPITGGPRNDIIPALEGRYDLELITGWWGWRWRLGNVKTRPLWLCGINHGTRLWLWDEEQESYVINGCLLFFCLISELASLTIRTVC